MSRFVDAEAHLDRLKSYSRPVRSDSVKTLFYERVKIHFVELLNAINAGVKAELREIATLLKEIFNSLHFNVTKVLLERLQEGF